MASLFRERDFALLWSGQSVSELGSSVTYVALPLVAVVALHARAFEVSVVTAASSIAWLIVGLPAGVWVDRLPRRPLLIGVDAGRALLMGTVPVAWWLHVLSLAQLVVVAFAVGLLSVFFDVGYPAYLPSVVPRDRLVEGNGALAASESAANIVGPGLGGVLVQLVGAPIALLADAASFVVSAVSLAAMRAGGGPPGPGERGRSRSAAGAGTGRALQRPPRQRLSRDIASGIRYVRAHPLPRTVAVAGALGNFVLGGYQAVIFVFLARQVGLSAGPIGVLLALSSCGGLLGALLAGPLSRRVGDARLMWAAPSVMAVFGLLVTLTGTGPRLAWYVAGALPMSLGVAAFNVCVRAAMQVAAPDAMLGRVTATARLLSRGATPVGALVAGALAGAIEPRATLVILLLLLVALPVWLLLSPVGRVREVAQLAPAPTERAREPVG
ncbi:MFS transporter [Rugosimonospora acidiphila]|uniref:MFS transporter n=1 Tax=Rugosimonospora acidiphila TaxID=556531 RepID=A0ABP9RWI0_9ACTN